MSTHVKILGWLYVVGGAVGLLFGLLFGGIATLAALFSGEADAAVAGGIIGLVTTVATVVMALPSLLIGWGLLKRKSWARMLAIVFSVIGLLGFPIGTIISIYALWVLFNDEVAAQFRGGQLAY